MKVNLRDFTEWVVAIEFLFNRSDEDGDTLLGGILEDTHEIERLRIQSERLNIEIKNLKEPNE